MIDPPVQYDEYLSSLLDDDPHSPLSKGRYQVGEAVSWHQQILSGLPIAAVERLKDLIGMADPEMARLLGIGEATLRRARASRKRLDVPTSDRLFRLASVMAVAVDVLGSETNAVSWLRRAQPGLDGCIPLDLLMTQAGADQVETLLHRIDHSVYS